MTTVFEGSVRRIDFEPKFCVLDSNIYTHVFLNNGTQVPGPDEVDVYTDSPRFEAAFLTALKSPDLLVEVHYDEVGNNINKVVRVAIERDKE